MLKNDFVLLPRFITERAYRSKIRNDLPQNFARDLARYTFIDNLMIRNLNEGDTPPEGSRFYTNTDKSLFDHSTRTSLVEKTRGEDLHFIDNAKDIHGRPTKNAYAVYVGESYEDKYVLSAVDLISYKKEAKKPIRNHAFAYERLSSEISSGVYEFTLDYKHPHYKSVLEDIGKFGMSERKIRRELPRAFMSSILKTIVEMPTGTEFYKPAINKYEELSEKGVQPYSFQELYDMTNSFVDKVDSTTHKTSIRPQAIA